MLRDLVHAVRLLRRSPGFTLASVVTLALGVGSVTVSFSALNALLLKPLPFIRHQERMLYVNEAIPSKGVDGTDIAYADFVAWRRRTQTLAAIWVYDNRTVILSDDGEPERLLGAGLSAGAFQAMGVQPLLGRNLRPEENDPKAPAVALISFGLWQRHFGGRPVLGRAVTLNGRPTTIVGVMPEGWRYPEVADIWVPLPDLPGAERGDFEYSGHAMLKPGVSLDQARAEMSAIAGALAREHPDTNTGLEVVLRPVREQATEDTAALTLLLFGAVTFVFLIACANVANLLLARASARTKEFALRLALGAGRSRLIRQLLAEGLLLALLGGAGGLLLASWGAGFLLAAIPVELPFWLRFGFDPTVFAFTFGLSLLSCLLFGLAPALQATRADHADYLREGGRTSAGGSRGGRVRQGLVVAEIALALVLLVGACLMARSFIRLRQVRPGFAAAHVLTFRVGFPRALSTDDNVFRRFFRDLLPRLSALPGVEAVGATSALPGLGQGGFAPVVAEGQAEPETLEETPVAMNRSATPDYFAALRIPLVAGRSLDRNDTADRPAVALVDEEFARRFFPNQDAVGRRFRLRHQGGGAPGWIEVVGVVGSVRRWIDRETPVPCFYRPFEQAPENFMSVALRLHGDPPSAVASVRQAVQAVNRGLPIYNVSTMEAALDRATWTRRAFGWYFAAFAGLALFLAAIGTYAVMSYTVAQRTHELGVRLALGARPGDVVRLVVERGLVLVGWGLGFGLAAAYFAVRFLAASLYGVEPHDALSFAAVPVLLALVALLACWLPARRAARVDPMVALRTE